MLAFKFKATEEDLKGLQIKVTIGNYTPYIYDLTDDVISYEPSTGRYVLTVENIRSKEYGEIVKVNFMRDGKDIANGPTAELSVNSYLEIQSANPNETMRNLIKALYNYGVSAYEYDKK